MHTAAIIIWFSMMFGANPGMSFGVGVVITVIIGILVGLFVDEKDQTGGVAF